MLKPPSFAKPKCNSPAYSKFQQFACCGFESRTSRHVGILASDMVYGVVRQGFDRGLQVFLCQQQGVHTSCGSCLQCRMHVRNPLLLPNG
jgi:hypothetical protein